MRGIATLVMRSPYHAAVLIGLFGSLSLMFLPLCFLSGAGVGLVTLRLGKNKALAVTLGAMLVTALLTGVAFRNPSPAVAFAVILWLPVILCSAVLAITESQGKALMAVCGLTAAYVTSMYVVVGDVAEWWKKGIETAIEVQQLPEQFGDQIMAGADFALMNGQIGLTVSLIIFVSVLLGRWWQSLLYNPGGYASEFQALRLPNTLAVVVAVLGILVATKIVPGLGSLWGDLLIIGAMMYSMQGLAIMHALITGRGKPGWWLLPIYAGLVLFTPHMVLGLVLIGLIDPIVKFRTRGVQSK